MTNRTRLQYAIDHLNAHDIEYEVINFKTGQIHAIRKCDNKLIEYFAGSGIVKGHPEIKGVHNLIRYLEEPSEK